MGDPEQGNPNRPRRTLRRVDRKQLSSAAKQKAPAPVDPKLLEEIIRAELARQLKIARGAPRELFKAGPTIDRATLEKRMRQELDRVLKGKPLPSGVPVAPTASIDRRLLEERVRQAIGRWKGRHAPPAQQGSGAGAQFIHR